MLVTEWAKKDKADVDATEICDVCSTTLSDKEVWERTTEDTDQNSPEFSTIRCCRDCQALMIGLDGITREQLHESFEYLDDIRESGTINMFAAPGVLESDMGISEREARKIVLAWMRTFETRRP